MRVGIEYVETNSSWYKDKESACGTLKGLKDLGLRVLLVSMSPFHNEHIAFRRVKEVMEACRLTGISVLPWIDNFFNDIDSFDDRVPHKLDEYAEVFGPDYIANIPRRYWVHFGGRALKTYERLLMLEDLQSIISSNPGGCREITDVNHFHIDLFGNYIPGLCSGLAVRIDDLGSPLFPEKYPILSTLIGDGKRLPACKDIRRRGMGQELPRSKRRHGHPPDPHGQNPWHIAGAGQRCTGKPSQLSRA
jgi:hypothetical protein